MNELLNETVIAALISAASMILLKLIERLNQKKDSGMLATDFIDAIESDNQDLRNKVESLYEDLSNERSRYYSLLSDYQMTRVELALTRKSLEDLCKKYSEVEPDIGSILRHIDDESQDSEIQT